MVKVADPRATQSLTWRIYARSELERVRDRHHLQMYAVVVSQNSLIDRRTHSCYVSTATSHESQRQGDSDDFESEPPTQPTSRTHAKRKLKRRVSCHAAKKLRVVDDGVQGKSGASAPANAVYSSTEDLASSLLLKERKGDKPIASIQLENAERTAPPEYMPRERRSSNYAERKQIEEAHEAVVNQVHPMHPREFESWDEVSSAVKVYGEAHCVRFRIRSSESRAVYNR
jgi:hypothetical protein